MAKLREPERPVPETPVLGADERRLFHRRMRRCGACGAGSLWTLEDAGPLCDLHLVEFGVGPPAVRPPSGMAIVKVR